MFGSRLTKFREKAQERITTLYEAAETAAAEAAKEEEEQAARARQKAAEVLQSKQETDDGEESENLERGGSSMNSDRLEVVPLSGSREAEVLRRRVDRLESELALKNDELQSIKNQKSSQLMSKGYGNRGGGSNVAELERMLDDKESRLDMLEVEKQDMRRELDAVNRIVESKENELRAGKRELEELGTEFVELRKELENERRNRSVEGPASTVPVVPPEQMDELGRTIAALEKELREQREKGAFAEAERDEAKNKVNSLVLQIASREAEARAFAEERDLARQQLSTIQLNASSAQSDQSRAEFALSEAVKSAEAAADKYSRDIAELEKAKQELETKNSQLEEDLRRAESHVGWVSEAEASSLHAKIKEADGKLQAAISAKTDLSAFLQTARRDRDRLSRELETALSDTERVAKELRTAELEVQRLQSEAGNTEESSSSLRAQVEDLQGKLARSEAQCLGMTQQIDGLRSQLLDSEEKSRRGEDDRASLVSQTESLQSKLLHAEEKSKQLGEERASLLSKLAQEQQQREEEATAKAAEAATAVEEERKRHEIELSQLKTALDGARKQETANAAAFEEQKKGKERQIAELETALDRAQQEKATSAAAYEEEKKRTEVQLAELRAGLDRARQEAAAGNPDMEKALQQATDEASRWRGEAEELKQQSSQKIQSLQTEVLGLRQSSESVKTMQVQVDEAKKERSKWEEERTQWREEKEAMTNREKLVQQKIADYERQLEEEMEVKKAKDIALEQAVQNYADLKDEYEGRNTAGQQVQDFSAEISSLKGELEQERSEKALIDAEFKALRQSKLELEGKIESLNGELQELKPQLAKALGDAERVSSSSLAESADQKADKARVEAELGETLQSKRAMEVEVQTLRDLLEDTKSQLTEARKAAVQAPSFGNRDREIFALTQKLEAAQQGQQQMSDMVRSVREELNRSQAQLAEERARAEKYEVAASVARRAKADAASPRRRGSRTNERPATASSFTSFFSGIVQESRSNYRDEDFIVVDRLV